MSQNQPDPDPTSPQSHVTPTPAAGSTPPGQPAAGPVPPSQEHPGQNPPGQWQPGQPMPGQSAPGQPMPGQPMPGQPMSAGHPGGTGQYPAMPSENERNLAVACHLSPFLAALLVISPLGPLAFYLMSTGKPYLRANAVEALNFNITMWIGVMVSWLLLVVGIGFITLPFFAIMMLVCHIIGAVKARDGIVYHYPMAFRLFN